MAMEVCGGWCGRRKRTDPDREYKHFSRKHISIIRRTIALSALSRGGYPCLFPPDPVLSLDNDEQYPKKTCYILSNSEDKDDDEVSMAGRERYAAMGVSELPNYELVETGPLVVGDIPTGRIMHMNFKAKMKDVPGAVVQTFFSELIKTSKKVVTVEYLGVLGLSDSLPEKADTYGCLYCHSHNIYHPGLPYPAYRNGREDHWTTLCSQVGQFSKVVRKCEEENNFNPTFSHPGVKYINESLEETYRRQTGRTDQTALAVPVALSMYNETECTNFELVKIGPFVVGGNEIGYVMHVNFEAKKKDDPDAQLQTFFAEVVIRSFVFADFCVCLGPSHLLPDEKELNGCALCARSRTHHPPPGPGYLTGRENILLTPETIFL